MFETFDFSIDRRKDFESVHLLNISNFYPTISRDFNHASVPSSPSEGCVGWWQVKVTDPCPMHKLPARSARPDPVRFLLHRKLRYGMRWMRWSRRSGVDKDRRFFRQLVIGFESWFCACRNKG